MFLLVLAVASPAAAHQLVDDGWVYTSSGPCTWGRAQASHGNGGGFARSDVAYDYQLQTPWGSYDCLDATRTMGAGGLAVAFDWYKWNGTSWYVCKWTDWYYNAERAHQFWIYKNFGASPDCGSGYYGTVSHSFAWINGSWRGGTVWSGYHYLPA